MRQVLPLICLTVALLLGGTAAAAVLYVLSGLVPPLPAIVAISVLAVFGAVVAGSELRGARLRLPQCNRQIPQSAFERGIVRGATIFGFQLGLGSLTKITAGSAYCAALGLLLIGDAPSEFAATGAAFGAGRALMPWVRRFDGAPEAYDEALRRSFRWLVPAATLLSALLLALAVVAQG